MHPQHATATVYPGASSAASLRGRGLVLARGGWVAVLLLHLGLVAATLPHYFAALRTVCTGAPCAS